MTNLENQLLAVVQEMEQSCGDRETRLTERLTVLAKELDNLTGQLGALSSQVASLTQLLNAQNSDKGNGKPTET